LAHTCRCASNSQVMPDSFAQSAQCCKDLASGAAEQN
jgi:hypothetical protein